MYTSSKIAGIAGTIVLMLGTAGCSGGAVGEMQKLHRLSAICPSSSRPAAYVGLDVSKSGRSKRLITSRLAAVQEVATQTAVCGGHLRVVAFSRSVAATQTLFDDDLVPKGQTENARLLRVPKIASDAIGEVKQALPGALRQLPPDGTDILGQLQAADDFRAQLGGGFRLRVLVLTDGESTRYVDLNPPHLGVSAAVELARHVSVPKLAGASITFAGLGKLAGPPAPTSYVDALRAFYLRVCLRTGAQSCLTVTDFTPSEG